MELDQICQDDGAANKLSAEQSTEEHTKPNDILAAEEAAGKFNEEPSKPRHTARFHLAYGTILLSMFTVTLELFIVPSAIESIARDLQAGTNEVFWCGTSYILTQTVTQPIFGSLSEIFGRKVLYQFSILLFLLGSIVCARAQTIQWLIVTRAVQGFGGGGISTISVLTIVDMTTVLERSKYIGGCGIPYGLGSLGLIIGAAFGQYSTWRWIFYINIPLCVIILLGINFSLELSLETSTFRKRIGQIDWIGMIVFAGSLTSLLIGIVDGGTIRPWKTAEVLARLIIGILGFVSFVFLENNRRLPMMPLSVFTPYSSKAACFQSFVAGYISISVVFYLIIYFLASVDNSLIRTGVVMLPVALAATLGGIIAGIFITMSKTFRGALWAGGILSTAGVGALASLKVTSNLGEQEGFQLLLGIGVGMLYTTNGIVAQAEQPDELHSAASNIVTFFRTLGSTFGIAIGGLLQPKFVILGQEAERSIALLHTFPGEIAALYRDIYSDSLRPVWYLAMSLGAAALLSSLFVKHASIDRGITAKQKFKN